MTEFGTKRQRYDESSMTPPERNEGIARRYPQGRFYPSIFSSSPGEFFSPVTLMRRFTEDLDRVFSTNFGASHLGRGMNWGESSEQDFTWMPDIEVRQSGNNLVIHADLPGLTEKDIKLQTTEEGLIIQGERRREQSSEQGGWHRSERIYGRFHRMIPLPESAKVEEIKANFRNGVLEIVVPVPELEKRNRQIPIQTSGQSLTSETGTFTEGRARAAGANR